MRCLYCKRPHPGSPAAYAENPWCAECLTERLELAAKEAGPVRMVRDGKFIRFVRGAAAQIRRGDREENQLAPAAAVEGDRDSKC